jgi:hypothetical protein
MTLGHSVPRVLDLELWDFMCALLGFGLALIPLLLFYFPIPSFWNRNVYLVSVLLLCVESILVF